MDREQANKEISKKLIQIRNLVSECQELAKENNLYFHFYSHGDIDGYEFDDFKWASSTSKCEGTEGEEMTGDDPWYSSN